LTVVFLRYNMTATAHQAHNIPWHILEDAIQPAKSNPNNWEAKSPSEQQPKKLEHFFRKFGTTVREFAVTERKKYPERISLLKVFSSDLICEYLPAKFQDINYWLQRANGGNYSSSDGDVADAIKELFNQDAILSLLYLAQQPGIYLQNIQRITYSHFFHYGIKRILEDGLQMYIFLNLLIISSRLR
jgi:hypothetical protein